MRLAHGTATIALVTTALTGVALTPSGSSAAALAPTCDGLRVTIRGTDGPDHLRGTPRRDVIHGLRGDDIVEGFGGDDVLCGGRGRDFVRGGAGDDRVFGGLDRVSVDEEQGDTWLDGDYVYGGSGDDLLDAGKDDRPHDQQSPDVVSFAGATRGVVLDIGAGTARGEGRDRIRSTYAAFTLTRYADTVRGDDRPNQVQTGAGDDVVLAGRGADRVDADAGLAIGRGGDDRVWGGRGGDYLTSREGRDEVYAGRGHDVVVDEGETVDVLELGDGDDTVFDWLVASPGQALRGGAGRDAWYQVFGTGVSATWDMATGALVVSGSVAATAAGFEAASLLGGPWVVSGTPGPDLIEANAPTVFHALAGDDHMKGSPGDDTFDGGEGYDVSPWMLGGADTCLAVEEVPGDCETVGP